MADTAKVDAWIGEAFAELGAPRPDERSDDELLAAIFDGGAVELDELDELDELEGEDEPVSGGRAPTWQVGVVVGSVLSAVAALVLLTLTPRGPDEGREARAPAAAPTAASMRATPAEVQWAHPGERHELEPESCRRLSAEVQVCARRASVMRVDEDSSEAAIRLELEAGALLVDGAQAPAAIELRTPLGRIIGGPGRFDVALTDNGEEVEIGVEAGRFSVEGQLGERARLDAGARFKLRAPRAAPPKQAPSETTERPRPSHKPAPATADELLGAAQRALAAGRRGDALAGYRALVERYPDTRAAAAGRVSLGRLLLASDARAALAHFEAYLEQGVGHGLEQEARYGRLQALRALGRGEVLAEAIAEFERRHPRSIHMQQISTWREELEAGEGDAP